MTAISLTATQEDAFVLNSPKTLVEGEGITYSITYLNATTCSSPSAIVYRNGNNDVTSTVMPSGSHSATGNVVTLKPITGLVGNATYIIAVTATVDGNTRVKKIKLIVQKDEKA